MPIYVNNIINEVERLPDFEIYGQVAAVVGLLVEVSGVEGVFSIGDHCDILARDKHRIACEVIGFREDRALLMPFGPLDGVSLGCRVEVSSAEPVIYPTEEWLGRVVDAFGHPIDGKGPLPSGNHAYPVQNEPPPAHLRKRVGGKLDLGVRAMNTFLTCCMGQRMGIFAGSGVGKSTLMSMMARNTDAEVSVIGLIGERGREAREFIEDDLGEEGMARSVVIVATSNEPPLVRRQAAYATLAVAEFFRDRQNEVLCLMDSVTRFAMAQREISLSVGEPPASKGYTPSVFAELPRLLERAGPGQEGQGDITGLFTVLVEGDDHNEPVADAVRGILDGHVVLDREIAERGRFPAINVLKSVSRTMPDCNTAEQNALVNRAKRLISTYDDMAELIRLGAYRRGTDPQVDEAIFFNEPLEQFLTQNKGDSNTFDECYGRLNEILSQQVNMAGPQQGTPVQFGSTQPQAVPPGMAPPGAPGQPGGQPGAQPGQPGQQPGNLMPEMPRVNNLSTNMDDHQ